MAMTKKQVYVLTGLFEGGTTEVSATPPAGHTVNQNEKTQYYVEEFDNAAQLSSYLTTLLSGMSQIESVADYRPIIHMSVIRKSKYVDSNT